MFSDSSEVLKFIKDEDVKFLDIRFTDLPGVQQHFNIPASTVDEEFFTVGQLFDGSSIRGFANIHESDMQLIPDVTTAYIDQFREAKTLIMIFDIYNPRNGEIYHKDPRQVAKKAEKYLASTGIADTAFFAPEAEFYIFDDVRFEVKQNSSFYHVDSEEGAWNSGRVEEGGNLANKTPYKGGYFPVSPVDKTADLRDDISLKLIDAGFILERSHHEVGTGGQAGDQLPLRHDGARGRRHPEVQVHRQEHLRAVGQGRDLHAEAALRRQRLGHARAPVAVDRRQAAVLRREGLRRPLRHRPLVHRRPPGARALGARLHQPDDQLATSAWSRATRLRSTWSTRPATARRPIRIPITGTNPKAKRIEFRAPDASGNPYLAFAAQLMAGLDGIKNRIEPHEPVDKDLYELPPEEAKNIPQVPNSLLDSLDALAADHEFLLAGGVFTPELIETWIEYKIENEIKPLAARPHPFEYELYFGV